MELVSELEPILRNKIVDKNGATARYTSLQDVNINTFDMNEIRTEVQATIMMQSDLGTSNLDITIRQYADPADYQTELVNYRQLEHRILITKQMNFIEMMPIIHIDKIINRIVYFIEPGKLISNIEDQEFNSDEIWGRIVALLHGVESFPLGDSNVPIMIEYMMQFLPLNETEKEKISMLLQPHFPIFQFTHGGYKPYTLIDPHQIRIRFMENKYRIFVPMNIVTDPIIDRMTDVASIFGYLAYQEFKQSGSVDNTKQRIQQFYNGYNSVLLKLANSKIQEYYPHGITLDLQMLINFFLLEMLEEKPFNDSDGIRYMYFLLLKKPFILS